MHLLIHLFAHGLVGFALGTVGITSNNWQFWVILLSMGIVFFNTSIKEHKTKKYENT